ncbi:hypothetical protein X975_23965, partial [Stegodyphus mimosarum]
MLAWAALPTEVSNERAFSSFKFILQDNRSNLSEIMLEYILIIRGNFQMLNK